MKRYKQAFSALVVLLLALLVLPSFTNRAKAAEEGPYIYTVEDGKATIIGFTQKVAGDIIIPDTLGGYPVAGIGNSAFLAFDRLFTVSIPATVTAIGDYAFYGCTSLSGIIIPNGVTTIGDYTFHGCQRLESVIIPGSVTAIGNYAFYNCLSLRAIVIPSSVTTIGPNAFSSCTDLWHILYAGTEAQWAGIQIGSDNANFTDAVRHYNCTDATILDLQNKQCRICNCTHTYDNACDTKCDSCGEIRSVTHSWGDGVCSVCGAIDPNATKPTETPTEPTTEPTKPTQTPTEPTTEPTKPTETPTEPTTEPTKPTQTPTEPTTEPTKPVEPTVTAPTIAATISAPTTKPATKATKYFPVVQTKPITTSPVELPTEASTASTDAEPTESFPETSLATEASAPTQPQEPVPHKQNRGLTWVIVSLSIVCLAGGGAAVWFMTKKKEID